MTRSAEKARRTSRLVAALGVGATIVAGIVGYVSYHALTGLPFQARYRVNVELPDAQRLGITDDVRIGGVRVGQVERVTAEPARQGRSPYALARLSLDPSVHELPVDTEAKIRAASALGATYVQLELGHARETLAPGGTLPLRQASGTVSATDLFDIFNASAARNFQRSTYELSAGLAGRGENISETLGALPPLLSDVTAVSAALAAPEARLSAFITAFDGVASELSPARAQLAGLVANGARTLNALAGERAALGGTIEAAPPAEEAVTQAFTRLRPGLDGLADLVVDLRPAGRSLRPALVTLNSTLPPGVAALRGVAALAPPLRQTVTVLRTISHLPSTSGALRKLASLMQGLERTLSALTPAQVHCNIISLFGQNLSSVFGMLGTGDGPAIGLGGIGTLGNSTDQLQSAVPAPDAHIDNLPHESATECESGNEPASNSQLLTNPAGRQANSARTTSPPPGALDRARTVGLLDPTR